MSSPKNIQRDGHWTEPKTANDTTWAADELIANTTAKVNGPSAVSVDKANVHGDNVNTYSIAANEQRCIGVFIQEPDGDNTPYRVKASANVVGQSQDDTDMAILVGYAPASITGTDDVIEDVYYIPFYGEFDDLIVVPTLVSGDPFYDRALCFGIAIQSEAGITTKRLLGHLSVQRLATKPPTMAQAVS